MLTYLHSGPFSDYHTNESTVVTLFISHNFAHNTILLLFSGLLLYFFAEFLWHILAKPPVSNVLKIRLAGAQLYRTGWSRQSWSHSQINHIHLTSEQWLHSRTGLSNLIQLLLFYATLKVLILYILLISCRNLCITLFCLYGLSELQGQTPSQCGAPHHFLISYHFVCMQSDPEF